MRCDTCKVKEHDTCSLDPNCSCCVSTLGLEQEAEPMNPEACPGCNCLPGEGITKSCNDAMGCGYWKKQEPSYPWCIGNPTKADCAKSGFCRRDPCCGN
jgi:hypothetical protein